VTKCAVVIGKTGSTVWNIIAKYTAEPICTWDKSSAAFYTLRWAIIARAVENLKLNYAFSIYYNIASLAKLGFPSNTAINALRTVQMQFVQLYSNELGHRQFPEITKKG
jgi:hypothetical protein